jgi:hypothetical protein
MAKVMNIKIDDFWERKCTEIDDFWERKCTEIVINNKLRISVGDFDDGKIKLMDISDRSDIKIYPQASNVILVECGKNREEINNDTK